MASDAPDFVLIHDAARPLVSRAVIEAVIAALEAGADGAVPMLAVADTLRRKDGEGLDHRPARQIFIAPRPRKAFALPISWRRIASMPAHDVTDDVAIAALAGLTVEAVPGEETNMKVTTEKDFALAEQLAMARGDDASPPWAMTRIASRDGDHVWLCGVKVPHDHGLEGHSDADAGLHALTDAILGCIGAGDIGQHFPPTRRTLARRAVAGNSSTMPPRWWRKKAARILHCDVTLICERPKIGPHREAMRARIAEILALDIAASA